ncbi:MAG: hypothetical protein ACOC0J_02875, partial [Myxococcota bacterium]
MAKATSSLVADGVALFAVLPGSSLEEPRGARRAPSRARLAARSAGPGPLPNQRSDEAPQGEEILG